MFPDLRLLISATVATFFLAAMAGLYASLRIMPDQIVARTESRSAIDDSPVMRISSGWPLPEPGRAAALRELTRIAKHPPFAEGGDINTAPGEPQSGMSANEAPAQSATGSTGTAVAPEPGADHPDVQGNIVSMPDAGNARARIGKARLVPAKKAPRVANKQVVKRLIVSGNGSVSGRTPDHTVDLLNTGYPLYLRCPPPIKPRHRHPFGLC